MANFNDCGWELENTNLKKRIFVCHMPGGGGEKLASIISQHPNCNTLVTTTVPETGRIFISQPTDISKEKYSITATHKTPKQIREEAADSIIIQILIPDDVWGQIGHIQTKIENCRFDDPIVMESHAEQHQQDLLPDDAFIDITIRHLGEDSKDAERLTSFWKRYADDLCTSDWNTMSNFADITIYPAIIPGWSKNLMNENDVISNIYNITDCTLTNQN
tara:strand:- start:4237 stop:4893 length:657 start_codon:yes stop_codon:yes gene_type:complete